MSEPYLDKINIQTREQLSPARLAAIAASVARRPHLWRDLVHHDPHVRSSALLTGADDHDVWVLGWDLGQGVELHDHGGASGALCVVEGLLTECFTSFPGGGAPRERRVGPGEVVAFGPRHVHDVWNPDPAQATSVHVYSPPLETMTFFSPLDGGRLQPVRTELAHAPTRHTSNLALTI